MQWLSLDLLCDYGVQRQCIIMDFLKGKVTSKRMQLKMFTIVDDLCSCSSYVQTTKRSYKSHQSQEDDCLLTRHDAGRSEELLLFLAVVSYNKCLLS